MELIDERSSAKLFYQTLSEKEQGDTKLAATADQEIVDVILSGRVSTASLSPPLPLPFLLLTPPFFSPFRPTPGSSLAAYASQTAS